MSSEQELQSIALSLALPLLDNVIANLELLPLRLNQRKNSDIGQRQRELVEQFHRAGMLSAARLKQVNEIAARSKGEQK